MTEEREPPREGTHASRDLSLPDGRGTAQARPRIDRLVKLYELRTLTFHDAEGNIIPLERPDP